ncbi:DMT family transporter [Chengkuizengella axinellae]|uniref:EamA family transporter n=1 Tax=Chengkuizengella axinellae TaxID=3064388 RepID=A0ABT9J5P8_9BACL|nr:EamA family transporter [Chengkuizengella sp. 2205SS18-9]MDP5276808.1 EamA family transporter [Chengkuizengella sp. 2205SS18-9]
MQASPKSKNIGIYLLLLLVPLFWGGSFAATKHVVTEIPPITAATIRFGLASLILLILVTFRFEWNLKLLKKHWIGLLVMAMTGIFLYNVFFFIGLKYTSAINGSLIMSTSPAFITLGAVLLLNESWSKKLGYGLVLAFIGVVIVILKGSIQTLLSLSFNTGDLLFLCGLICWVTQSLVGKVVMKEVSPVLTTTVTMLIGSLMLTIWSLFEGGWVYVPGLSIQSWIELMYMSILATVIGFFIWNKGISVIGASKSGLYMSFVPIHASWSTVLFYGETFTWPQLVGIAFVILGVYISTANKTKRKNISNLIDSKPIV